MTSIRILVALFVIFTNTCFAQQSHFNYSTWNSLLQESVVIVNAGHASRVNYSLLLSKKDRLEDYLKQAALVKESEFNAWDKNEQLAFLINLYNASTVNLILTKYPDLKSIKDLGSLFSSPWKKDIVHLFGKTISLDDVEHGLIRGSHRYNDPRVHFAVNCASIGCPMLRNEAYDAIHLDQQLEDQARRFLSDPSRNRYQLGMLEVSPIFKWYSDDFKSGWRGTYSLNQFFAIYAKELGIPRQQMNDLNNQKVEVKFLDYDWNLNSEN
ncbi:hypothetical protein FERRO_17860 [Ferrovum sp. JA12]|uniref:DUF547 domain-containing protein n=1 Tax=Ferrovum sp. JA12 TaxID=1356299 RepID=UPI000702450E|nr:DUF547 domain-containing protein [Ferrovum sp. JA12]KRH78790.1 hypothetical protein FERRO_17860 [Ferrovum sp. JA12]